jgi:hypothetical protein
MFMDLYIYKYIFVKRSHQERKFCLFLFLFYFCACVVDGFHRTTIVTHKKHPIPTHMFAQFYTFEFVEKF